MAKPRPRFGRLAAEDSRDKLYPLRAILPLRIVRPPQHYWSLRWVGDQTQYPEKYPEFLASSCVGHGWYAWLRASPICNRLPDALMIYAGAKINDEWPGTAYAGSSVRGGVEFLRSLPTCQPVVEYRWAAKMVDILDTLAVRGPVVCGTDWTEDMLETDSHGFVHPTGEVVGGHCWTILGYDEGRRAVRAINSWGKTWGQRGRFWLSYDELDDLIFRRGGEVCVATEQKTKLKA